MVLKKEGLNSFLGWNDLTPGFFLEFRSQLTLEPQSVNQLISVLRLFF
ncbi:hypothetical protein GMMP15_2020021 [Candidatus Magnetomoraceae bacterium gMMP-15]